MSVLDDLMRPGCVIPVTIESIAALGGEVLRLRAASEWHPIETAPKDGTEIIVFHPEAGVCAAFCPKDGFSWHCMDGSNTVVGSKSGVSIPSMTSFVTQPTHWMPLPAPPSPLVIGR